MLKRRSRHFALLLVLTMLATMFIGVGTASAYSINRVDKVVSVDDEYTGAPSTLTIKEDDDYATDFAAGESFMITLPSGVNWDNPGSLSVTLDSDDGATFVNYDMLTNNDARVSSDQVLDITFPAGMTAGVETITIALGIEVDTFSGGDITAVIDALDSGVTSGTYVFARVLDGTTKATAMSVETIGDGGTGGDIRLEENAVNAVGNAAQEIEFKLPNHFDWDVNDLVGRAAGDVDFLFAFSGGFSSMTFSEGETTATIADGEWNADVNGDTITLLIDPPAGRTQRGIITMDTPINPDSDANYGDVEVSISGDEVDDADVVVAEYADYGVDVTIDEVKDIIAGKYNQELETITIEENVPGTLIANRDIHFEFPSWVKITDVSRADSGGGATFATAAPSVALNTGDVDGTSNEMDLTVTGASTGSTGKIEVDFEISVQGNQSGDIELVVSSKNGGLAETKLVVGKAICPVSATSDGSKDIKIGLQSQELSDIVITENIDEAITDDPEGTASNGEITLTLPGGAKFASKPTVEVLEGNLEIDEDSIDLVDANDTVDNRLSIPVDSASSRVSKIKVSGIKVTVDRTVPEGDFYVLVGGVGVIENSRGSAGWLDSGNINCGGAAADVDEGEFDTGTASKVLAAQVVTPAPGEVSNAASFVIGTASYKLNGVDQTMDVAPYIKDSRTYMPLRYVGYALGINDANMLWDGTAQSVTLMKGDKVVQVTIGSKTLLVNGAAITMDVAPEISNSRTMLPISFIANAFGATASWDAATQTVSIK